MESHSFNIGLIGISDEPEQDGYLEQLSYSVSVELTRDFGNTRPGILP